MKEFVTFCALGINILPINSMISNSLINYIIDLKGNLISDQIELMVLKNNNSYSVRKLKENSFFIKDVGKFKKIYISQNPEGLIKKVDVYFIDNNFNAVYDILINTYGKPDVELLSEINNFKTRSSYWNLEDSKIKIFYSERSKLLTFSDY